MGKNGFGREIPTRDISKQSTSRLYTNNYKAGFYFTVNLAHTDLKNNYSKDPLINAAIVVPADFYNFMCEQA